MLLGGGRYYVEAASRLEAITIRLEVLTIRWRPSLLVTSGKKLGGNSVVLAAPAVADRT